jgi:glycosyltransferase involved in cell wall biosynthesis
MALLPGERRPRLRLVYQNAELEPQLKALSVRLGIEHSVEFLGFLGSEALSQVYSGCDALVLPSYGEGLPSVITEAMLCGLPVIATTVGGIPDQVGTTGVLVPPGDPEALARAIETLLARLPLGQAERDALRVRAQAQSSIPAMIDAHLKVYEQVIALKRRHRVRGVVDRIAHAIIDLYRHARNLQDAGAGR